jgi:hypothetical protein
MNLNFLPKSLENKFHDSQRNEHELIEPGSAKTKIQKIGIVANTINKPTLILPICLKESEICFGLKSEYRSKILGTTDNRSLTYLAISLIEEGVK